jgi:lysophospholipase L1-like esterase
MISNSDGMRETEDYPLQRVSNDVRIIGIGDSGMFGWDLNQNEDYLAVLETNLNGRQDGRLYEVLNLAVPGYNTRLEVEALRAKGLKYKPDIVIVGWCDNDFSLPFFMIEKENYRRRDVSFLYRLVFKRAPKNNNRTELAPGITLRDHRDFDEELVLPELTTGSDVDRVRAALADLKAMAEQNGFKVLVFGPLPEICRRICTEVGVPFSNTYDLIPAAKYPKEYLVHWMHPSKDGHRVLAECLEKDLVDRGWLPPLPPK